MALSGCAQDRTLWKELHDWFVNQARDKEADVLFIGGDHIALLGQSQFYSDSLAPLHCLCFGSLGDSAANLLWRIENGEAENFVAKVVVVSIGQTEAETLQIEEFLKYVESIANTLKQKQPNAEIFFLELIPTGRNENKQRVFVKNVNSKLKNTLNGLATVIKVDSSLVDASGEIDVRQMFDFEHLSQAGYQTVFEPVLNAINSVLNP